VQYDRPAIGGGASSHGAQRLYGRAGHRPLRALTARAALWGLPRETLLVTFAEPISVRALLQVPPL